MLAHSRRVIVALLLCGDGALIAAAFVVAHWSRAHLPILEYRALQPLEKCLPILPLVVFLWLVSYAVLGLYSLDRPKSAAELVLSAALASGLGLLLFLALAFMLREFHASRLMLINFWLLAALTAALFRICLQAWLRTWARRGWAFASVLVVGAPDAVERICWWINARPGWGLRPVPLETKPGQKSAEALLEAVGLHHPREVIFVGRPGEAMLAACGEYRLRASFLPDLPPLSLLRLGMETVAGLPAFRVRELPASAAQQALKRALDLALSTVFLLLGAPLFLLLAALIKLDSPGPIFFRQTRIGRDGRPFAMLKFRSMKAEAAKAPPTKVEGRSDPRLTRIGGWLRRLSLDELPQLLNVLKGEMSLVGPRPETPLYVQQYSDWNRLRLYVKPGLAGMAQAHGVRGNTTIDEKTRYDLAYIEAQSPALDLALLAKTVLTFPLHREAY